MSEQQRWRVASARSGALWWARPDGVGWPVPFDTWEEAMRFADEQARTVTVTLPANPDRVLPATNIMMSSGPEGVWTERTYRVAWDWDVTIPDAYRETVALALLAHARKDSN